MNTVFTSDQVEQLLAVLQATFGSLSVAYLYGSAAQDCMHAESDIDVAVDIGRPLTSAERWDAAQKLSISMKRDVDLVDFRDASDVLRQQILTAGRRIFVHDAVAQSSYEAGVLSEYLDFVARRAPLMQDIAARGAVYAK